jgi:hypothetical protein
MSEEAASAAYDRFKELVYAAGGLSPGQKADIICAAIDYATERACAAIERAAETIRPPPVRIVREVDGVEWLE